MREVKVAIVGPEDSVNLIKEIAEEHKNVLNVIPFIYRDAADVPGIIASQTEEVDVWLFSGKVPYNYALTTKATNKPLLYIPHTGTSLYRVLLQMIQEGVVIENVSFDTLSRKDIIETFNDIQLPMPEIYVNDYDGIVSTNDITEYHYELWKVGKSKIAVTCFLTTYIELKKRGVSCFRIWPTRNNIRTILEFAINRAETLRYKGGQIAIQHIGIDDYDEVVRQAKSNYAVMKLEVRLYDILVNYTEKVQGTIDIHGNGQYTIYSTRGAVEEATHSFKYIPIHDQIEHLDIAVSGGIGFGDTVYDAHQNAHVALGLAQRKGKRRWMVVLDDKTVLGPLNSDMELSYSIRTEDANSRELAKKLSLSVTTLNKLFAVCRKIEGKAVDADTLAQYLSITPRSARRLLGNLVNSNFAKVVGEEIIGSGRPRKLYKVFMKEFADFYRTSNPLQS